MHFCSFLPLILSLGQFVLANPLRIDITIEDNTHGQSPTTLSLLEWPNIEDIRIRAIVLDSPLTNYFLNVDETQSSTKDIVLSRRPARFRLQDGFLEPSDLVGSVQLSGDGALTLTRDLIKSVTWAAVGSSRFGELLAPVINDRVQEESIRIVGDGPDGRVVVCGPQFEYSCADDGPHLHAVLRFEPFYVAENTENDNLDESLSTMAIFDDSNLKSSQNTIIPKANPLASSSSDAISYSMTETDDRSQFSLSQTLSRSSTQDLDDPFILRAIPYNSSPDQLFLNISPVPVYPAIMALQSTPGLFFLRGGNLVSASQFNGGNNLVQPSGYRGRLELVAGKQSQFGWTAVQSRKFGLVLAPTLAGAELNPEPLVNTQYYAQGAQLFVCGNPVEDIDPCRRNPVYLRVESVRPIASL